ncbi:MAG: ThiF family adenylyltransferase [Myxococcales bacterium]|nr:ThiF family adenylyltransferase [Myxococcales bacterium]
MPDAPTAPDLPLDELAEALARGEPLALLDVREADEFEAAHVPGARSLPLSQLESAASRDALAPLAPLAPLALVADLDPGARVVTFCASGRRAARARDALSRLGLSGARAAASGMLEWLARGLPAAGAAVPHPDDARRYARQLRLPEVGPRGQARLARARVAIVGVGGLGCPAALYLAAAGVGHLTLVDPDLVSLDNLHRQVLFRTDDVGTPKVSAARAALLARSPRLTVEGRALPLGRENAIALLGGHDLLVDATDNYAARAEVNRASCELEVPAVFGAVARFEGQVTTRLPGRGPCYVCLHPSPPGDGMAPTCAEEGVLGVVPGVIGLLQAHEALKVLLGYGDPLVGTLLHFDARTSRFRALGFDRAPGCAACGAA